MLTSKQALLQEAKIIGYRPEILEKITHLLKVLEQFSSEPYLRDRLVLKGGTALNLFCLNPVPRLSVDIDLNYIGQVDREKMLSERPVIAQTISQILLQNQFQPDRNPNYHAGGKMVWRYSSLLGKKGNLEIDLNYMYRQPLWPCLLRSPVMTSNGSFSVNILDIHELAAGKLSALFSRRASRDLFDAHSLLTKCQLNSQQLSLSFVIYLAMTSINLSNLKIDHIDYDIDDLRNRLLPVLHQSQVSRSLPALKSWASQLLDELREALRILLPLNNQQIDFIQQLRKNNQIKPELITEDKALQQKVLTHSAILWVVNKAVI